MAADEPGGSATPVEQSVLAALGSSGREMPRVRLRGAESGTDVLASGGTSEARYQELGEIARGGMGVVLRTRDADLGRDVAMKLLLEELAGREEVVERFVEEAQIGSQLQHPGIVPVYDLGLRGGRPYFTMKLIKGRTFAALLAERASPDADLGRYLSIFERACHTMAYAHARGVVHRDLKPSNVMTGTYGEVQVVDWGLGKVLGEGGVDDERRARRLHKEKDVTVVHTVRSGTAGSHSHVGSVLGTPAYMPPEQARGENEDLDERADVFALGAILCEVLTGSPPYTGSGVEPLRKAQKADLSEAGERLRSCHADPALIALAMSCMAPAVRARPRNAGAVAKELTAYHARVEDRAREAEEAAARSHAEATAHARQRRLTVLLAAAVALVVGVGGAGFSWVAVDDARQAAAATRAVDAALEDASRAHGAAVVSGTPDAWADVVSAARRAEALARAEGVGETELARATAATATAVEGARVARESEAKRARDAEIRARITALFNARSMVRPEEYNARVEALAADLGIDLRTLEADAAAAKVRASPWAMELTGLLEPDAWFAGYERRGVAPYRAVAKAADTDPWRTKVREARDAKRWDDVLKLIADVDVRKLPVSTVALLATALPSSPERSAFLRQAWVERPDNPEIHLALNFFENTDTGGAGDVVIHPKQASERRHAFANLALAPDSSYAWAQYGNAVLATGDLKEAERIARETIARTAGKDADAAHSLLVWTLRTGERWEDQRAAARAWCEAAPQSAEARRRLAMAEMSCEDYDTAVKTAEAAARLDESDPWCWTVLGIALHQKWRIEDAITAYQKALVLAPDADWTRARIAYLLDAQGKNDEAVALLEEGIAKSPESYALVYYAFALRREPTSAKVLVEGYRRALEKDPRNTGARQWLAYAFEHVGDHAKMLEELRRIEDLTDAGWSHQDAARLLSRAGADRAAIAEAEEDLRRNPVGNSALDGLLVALASACDSPRVLAVAEKAVARDPTNPWFHMYRALGRLHALGDADGAEAAVRMASTFAPNSPEVQRILAVIQRARGEDETALRSLDRSVAAVKSDDPAAAPNRWQRKIWRTLTYVLHRRRLFGRANERFRDYVRFLREDPDHRPDDLARAEEELRVYERMAGLAPEYPAMVEGLYDSEDAEDLAIAGAMLRRGGEPVRAVAYFERAFERSPPLASSRGIGYRRDAAFAAGRAAGPAFGLDDAGRAAMRERAYAWLRADLAGIGRSLADADDLRSARRRAANDLVPQGYELDLAEVCFPSKLESLPPAEAARWRALWQRARILAVLCEPDAF